MSRKIALSYLFAGVVYAGVTHASDADSWIAKSDDLEIHRDAFLIAATELVENGTCTPSEFVEHGGWVRSNSFESRSVYFMYCGGPTVANRLYLDASTGEVFR
ncbi:hypothetical protein [Ruegeria arenilitoris]|uniref:hypothetical protein n=1 Tax=Ruegeria arenilitoris TaxID=1173585 RepID=UPI001479BEF2|nr:hypothetical protein [Ruegeria arenilitoris]